MFADADADADAMGIMTYERLRQWWSFLIIILNI